MNNCAASQEEAFPLAGSPFPQGDMPLRSNNGFQRPPMGVVDNLRGSFSHAQTLHNSFCSEQILHRRNTCARISSGRLTYRPCNPLTQVDYSEARESANSLIISKTCNGGGRHSVLIAPRSTAGGRRHNSLIKLNSVESTDTSKHEQGESNV